MTEIKAKADITSRKWLMTAESFKHPAKMSIPVLLWIVQRYTKRGDMILDPMAGAGTTMLACWLGRNCVLVELEQKFVDMCNASWEKLRRMPPALGFEMGHCEIRQGDARQLAGVLVDVVIFSPPYSDVIRRGNSGGPGASGKGKPPSCLACYSEDPSNIGNLPYGDIDVVIASPLTEAKENIGNTKGDTYLRAMRIVYQQCYRCLKPHGLMILVVKPCIRNQQVIHLERDTQKLCESVGFTFLEEHYRRLTHMTFWRTLYYSKHPKVERVDKEFILVFRKEASV